MPKFIALSRGLIRASGRSPNFIFAEDIAAATRKPMALLIEAKHF